MKVSSKFKITGVLVTILLIFMGYIYFRYFFSYEQKNQIRRQIETFTGINLTVTVFAYNGQVVKKWYNVKKITSGKSGDGAGERNYTYFYTDKGKYVQIPDSVFYIAEED